MRDLRLGIGLSRKSGGAFNPVSLFSGTGGFLFDAGQHAYSDAGTTLATDGQGVQQLNDISGNGRNVSQATGTKRPLWAANSGFPYLDADGTDDFLAGTLNANLNQPSTLFISFKLDTDAARNLVDVGNAAKNLAGARSSAFVIWAGGTVISGPATDGNNHVLYGVFNGASSSIQIDNGAPATGNAGANNPANGDAFALFSIAAGTSEFWDGRIYRIGFINRALTATEKANVITWCAAGYGGTL